jgi:hypothetical protein
LENDGKGPRALRTVVGAVRALAAAGLLALLLLLPAATSAELTRDEAMVVEPVGRSLEGAQVLDLGAGAIALAWMEPTAASARGLNVAVSTDDGSTRSSAVAVADRLPNGPFGWTWAATSSGFAVVYGDWSAGSPAEMDGPLRLASFDHDGTRVSDVPFSDGFRPVGHLALADAGDGRLLMAGLGDGGASTPSRSVRVWDVTSSSEGATARLVQQLDGPPGDPYNDEVDLEVRDGRVAVVWEVGTGDRAPAFRMAWAKMDDLHFASAALDLPFQAWTSAGGAGLHLDGEGTARFVVMARPGASPEGPVRMDIDNVATVVDVPWMEGPRSVHLQRDDAADPGARTDYVHLAVTADGRRLIVATYGSAGRGWKDTEAQVFESRDGGTTFGPPTAPFLDPGEHIGQFTDAMALGDGRVLLVVDAQQPTPTVHYETGIIAMAALPPAETGSAGIPALGLPVAGASLVLAALALRRRG